jgi:hypothetical protein
LHSLNLQTRVPDDSSDGRLRPAGGTAFLTVNPPERLRSDLLMHRLKGYGIAIMTNTDSGGQIIEEIEARVAAAAEWDTLDKPVLR